MANLGTSIASTQSLELDLPPSCIEFCPAHPPYFVVGTYNLQRDEPSSAEHGGCLENDGEEGGKAEARVDAVKKPQSRNGSIVVYHLRDRQVSHVQTVSHPSAILDLHFQPQPGKQDVCGVVSSTGTLTTFRLSPTPGGSDSLRKLSSLRLPEVEDDVLFTAFAWHPTITGLLAVTTSTGAVYLAQLSGVYDALQAYENVTIMHSLEAWCVAFSPSLPLVNVDSDVGAGSFTLYSGGDDSTLRYLSCTLEDGTVADDTSAFQAPYPAMKVSGHDAGVTAILPLALAAADGSHIVLTGSYDDVLRVFAIKPLTETYGARQARLLTELNLGGGVWRMKLISLNASAALQRHGAGAWRALLLVSCMHAGARVVEIRGDATDDIKTQVLGRFEEHKSMNYGSDFQSNGEDGDLLCVSTSFYDKLLCLWEFQDALP